MGNVLTVRLELNFCTVYQFGRNQSINIDNSFLQRVEQVIFGNTNNKSKFYSGIKGQTEVRQCLLSFGAESSSSSLLYKDLKIKIYRTISVLVVL
jgi:CRISPR/Cas system CMR-associated protein Cmr1 (group 7 of RAMP superfamily)